MELSPADIRLILSTLQESGYDEAEVVVGDVRIAVARGGARLATTTAATPAPPVPTPAAPQVPVTHAAASTPAETPSSAPAAGDAGTVQVTSPTIGVFWRASEPGAAPFVEVGTRVAVGDTIGIVEVMKLMSNVASEVAGVVTAVHVSNAEGVEFGTPLVSISPEG